MSRLFGLDDTNKDFDLKESWGKNQFNNAFPTALCCYLDSKKIPVNYIVVNDNKTLIVERSFSHLIDIEDGGLKNCRFDFEDSFNAYRSYCLNGEIPRTDLVVSVPKSDNQIVGLEVKLTALPDQSTFDMDESEYGCELVVRPDSIVYLACSLAYSLERSNGGVSAFSGKTISWNAHDITTDVLLEFQKEINEVLSSISVKDQLPFLLQPVWKTKGKDSSLATNCLDVFVWSEAAFAQFLVDIAKVEQFKGQITRQVRSLIWLYKMLRDISTNGHMDHERIIDELSYGTRNDKAFASSGRITREYMASERLLKPIVTVSEIKNIILDGGHEMLSPERRFDAVIKNTPGIF